MLSTILQIDSSAKHEPQIRCSHCSTTAVIRYGTYPRDDPGQDKLIRVQRFLCKSIVCPWRTFSVVPRLILPVIRHSWDSLLACHQLYNVKEMSQAAVARQMQVSRGIVKRLGAFCRELMPWLEMERKIADWGSDMNWFWADFTRDFSQKCFPVRWLKPPPTQIKPFY